jgi:hypothetical protein
VVVQLHLLLRAPLQDRSHRRHGVVHRVDLGMI